MPNQKTAAEQATLDRNLLHILLQHKGKANAIDRWALVERVFGSPVPADQQNDRNIQDREIRLSVSRLRLDGHLICDVGNGNGRWIAANEEEFWDFHNYYVAPLIARAEVARAMKKAAAEQWPDLNQMKLFDVDKLGVTS